MQTLDYFIWLKYFEERLKIKQLILNSGLEFHQNRQIYNFLEEIFIYGGMRFYQYTEDGFFI